MPKPSFLQIAVPAPLAYPLDYLAADEHHATLMPGVRVRVPFRRKEVVGILIAVRSKSDIAPSKLKPISAVLDEQALISAPIMQLGNWVSRYYHQPIGEVFATMLPTLLRQGKPAQLKKLTPENSTPLLMPDYRLNPAQLTAVQQVAQTFDQFQAYLLHGVTGSGKTEVYLQLIQQVLAQGQQALVLVPEIGLTPQTVARFRQRFAKAVVVLHSGLTDRQRLDAWLQASQGQATIVIGTRSAIFTPLPRLGILIVDEEHDISYKQQDGLRYSARDLAVVRAKLENVPLLLGSATPSLESLHNANKGNYQKLDLPERAGSAKLPPFTLIDLRNQHLEQGLSKTLVRQMQVHLNQQQQVLLFLNRRGFAPTLMCRTCNFSAKCQRCDLNFTYHKNSQQLRCHHCGSLKKILTVCPDCQQAELLPIGLGTERIEAALEKHFAGIPIVRIDSDSTRRKGALDAALVQIQKGGSQILIGTQMLAKGHHFPNVSLVAIIDGDSGFFSSDMRAAERMGQLLMQVAGRAGRADTPGEVFIQTHHPDHPLLLILIQHGYATFAKHILMERQQAQLPPFSYLTLLRAEDHQQEITLQFLQAVCQLAKQIKQVNIHLLGPIPAPIERRAGRYRSQLLIQADQRPQLQRFLAQLLPQIPKLKQANKVRWAIDVDPMDMA